MTTNDLTIQSLQEEVDHLHRMSEIYGESQGYDPSASSMGMIAEEALKE